MPGVNAIVVGSSLLAAVGASQFPSPYPSPSPTPYPFPSPSGYCECEQFCKNKCSYDHTNATNATVYRMSPFGVYDLSNKNTGNVVGDTQFVLSKRTDPNHCRQYPTSPACKTFVQFDGDDPNSTDLVIEMQVEWDGRWGTYLECNDLNTSDPLGQWVCAYNGYYPPPGSGGACGELNFTSYINRCFGEDPYEPTAKPFKTEAVKDTGSCCKVAAKYDAKYWMLSKNGTECAVWKKYPGGMSACSDGTLGLPATSQHPSTDCETCPRVFKAMGRQSVSISSQSLGVTAHQHQHQQQHLRSAWPSPYPYPSPAPYEQEGYWYSHPADGECKDGHYVGDGSGCTWRLVKTLAIINASCMYEKFDTIIEAADPTCFVKCADPTNKTSECYSECYTSAMEYVSHRNLTNTWKSAFQEGKGGCPRVHVKGLNA